MKKSRLKVIPQTEQFGYGINDIETSGEKELFAKLLSPGAVLFDMGAERGTWTLAALQIEPNIYSYSFESDALLYTELKGALAPYKKANVYPVSSLPLDQFCFSKGLQAINFLKVGAKNIALLKESENFLAQGRVPNIQFVYNKEFSERGISLKDAMQFLSSQNYVLFRVFSHGLIHMSQWKDWLDNEQHCNYFAILRSNISQCEPMTF